MPLYRVTVKTTSPGAGGDCLNVLHFRTVGGIGESTDADIVEALDALRQTYADTEDIYANGSTHSVGDTVIADPYGSPTYYPFTPVTVPGSNEGGVAPPHLAICVGLRTTSATRRGRGRVFLGPLNSQVMQSEDGTIRSDFLIMARNAWNSFIADSNTANGWGLAVYSDVDHLARDVTSGAIRDSLAVMRSRRP